MVVVLHDNIFHIHNNFVKLRNNELLVPDGARRSCVQDGVGEKLPEELGGPREGSNMIPENYELVIDCKDEAEQKTKFEELAAKGWKVRVLNL